jgi:hypothetical protein
MRSVETPDVLQLHIDFPCKRGLSSKNIHFYSLYVLTEIFWDENIHEMISMVDILINIQSSLQRQLM